MKILLAAPQSSDTVLGVIGIFCKKALMALGHNVEILDFRQRQFLKGHLGFSLKKNIKKFSPISYRQLPFVNLLEKKAINRLLIKTIEEYQPHILFVLIGETILPETLQKIKKLGVITSNWFVDPIFDPTRIGFVREIAPYYDYFFIHESQDILNHIKICSPCVKNIPLACDPSVHKTMTLTEQEKRRFGSQVCFVGSVNSIRERVLRHLTDFDLAIWGNWIRKDVLLSRFYREKYVYLEQATKIYNASDISLDIHVFFGTDKGVFSIAPRVFEATASGAFVMTNESPYLADLYQIDKEIVCYKDEGELKEKIKFYLAYPEKREMIARRGQERAYREHTYELRLKKIFSIIEKNG